MTEIEYGSRIATKAVLSALLILVTGVYIAKWLRSPPRSSTSTDESSGPSPPSAVDTNGASHDRTDQTSIPTHKNSQDRFPALRTYNGRPSRGVEDVREVIKLLSEADIPSCVVGIHALRCYGAGRATWVSPLLSLSFLTRRLPLAHIFISGVGFVRARRPVRRR